MFKNDSLNFNKMSMDELISKMFGGDTYDSLYRPKSSPNVKDDIKEVTKIEPIAIPTETSMRIYYKFVGADKANISVTTVNDNNIRIVAKYKTLIETYNVDTEVKLGSKYNVQKISASLKNGLLEIIVPLSSKESFGYSRNVEIK